MCQPSSITCYILLLLRHTYNVVIYWHHLQRSIQLKLNTKHYSWGCRYNKLYFCLCTIHWPIWELAAVLLVSKYGSGVSRWTTDKRKQIIVLLTKNRVDHESWVHHYWQSTSGQQGQCYQYKQYNSSSRNPAHNVLMEKGQWHSRFVIWSAK